MMEDIEGRLRQLDNAPGTVRAREVAFESANKTMDEITKLQEIQNGKNASRAHKIRENLGIKNEQELEQMRKQAEEEMQRTMEEAAQQAEQTISEQESEVLYN
jgi:F0F1-type ATP synthase membrane subunit b/b'